MDSNINIVSLSGRVTDFSTTVEGGSKTGSFYLEWSLPVTVGTQQTVDRIFCMVRDDAVTAVQRAVESDSQVYVQGRIRTRVLRYEGKGKKPVHAAYIAAKTVLIVSDGTDKTPAIN